MDRNAWSAIGRVILLMAALMSGALSIVREFLLFAAPSRFQERTLFWASVRVAFVLSAGATWWLENRDKKRLQNEKMELEAKYSSEEPRLGLNVVSASSRRAWNEAADSRNTPVHFSVQHLSGRIPTSVRFDPVPSKLGKFSLRFDALAHVEPPVQKLMTYEVWEDGRPPDSKVIGEIGWGSMLLLFVEDSPPGQEEMVYTLTVRFKDSDQERLQQFHLVFDRERFCFKRDTSLHPT